MILENIKYGRIRHLTLLNPQNADYYVNRGLAYMGKGDNATAVADLEKALSLDPSNNKAKLNLQKIESEV